MMDGKPQRPRTWQAAIMLMAAMLYLVVVAFRALGGQETSVHHDGVKSAALLWDAMVLVYGLIWISIYVMK